MLDRNRLKIDILSAFYCAKRHKANKEYVKIFESNLDDNISELCNELLNHAYKPSSSTCFVIDFPKKREIFAAPFRDRIVHHLYFNYTHEIFESTFIYDAYSCIKGKGTHFGINRLEHHIKSCSENYTKQCYCLKFDIKSYFNFIDRNILLEEALKTLKRNREKTEKVTNFEFVEYLTRTIILYDPVENSEFRGNLTDYYGLARSKSLRNAPPNCGLPIGNLTSQLFSNVYLNVLDQYIKRELKCKHYGRYVDDGYIVDTDRGNIKRAISSIRKFLKERLHLDLQEGKTQIRDVKYGVEFLGAYLKPYRRYVSNQSLNRMKRQMRGIEKYNPLRKRSAIISKIGVLSHYKSYKIVKELFYGGK